MFSKKYTKWLLNIILLLAMAIEIIFLFWHLYPYELIEWNINEYQTIKDTYVVGETLTYRTAFCKKGNYVANQIRRLQDGVVYLYPELQSSTKEGCYDFIANTTEVPNVPSGEYFFEIEFVYRVNPIREVRYTMRSNKFTIINDGL